MKRLISLALGTVLSMALSANATCTVKLDTVCTVQTIVKTVFDTTFVKDTQTVCQDVRTQVFDKYVDSIFTYCTYRDSVRVCTDTLIRMAQYRYDTVRVCSLVYVGTGEVTITPRVDTVVVRECVLKVDTVCSGYGDSVRIPIYPQPTDSTHTSYQAAVPVAPSLGVQCTLSLSYTTWSPSIQLVEKVLDSAVTGTVSLKAVDFKLYGGIDSALTSARIGFSYEGLNVTNPQKLQLVYWNGVTMVDDVSDMFVDEANKMVYGTVRHFSTYALVELSGNVPGEIVPDTDVALLTLSPNPFNPTTAVLFTNNVQGKVRVAVYNITGTMVRELVNREMAAGTHKMSWNGRDSKGVAVASGSYIVRFEAGQKVLKRIANLIR